MNPLDWIGSEMDSVRALRRERIALHLASSPGPEVILDDERLLHMCSNNYLGLATDPRVIDAALEATRLFGTGAGASRLVSGGSTVHRALEERIAAWKGAEDAIVFSSGYLANVGTIGALAGRGDRVVSDALNHASVIDGCRASGADVVVYAHADVEDLRRALAVPHDGRTLVVTDTVFSMDGDAAPLREIVFACEEHGAMLMVDEAHAGGLLGARGSGLAEGLRVPVVMGTLSKALGAAGGYVAGSSKLIAYLRNKARTFVFDTALPAGVIGAALKALEIVVAEPHRRERALRNARTLALGLREAGYEGVPAEPAACIVPVVLGDEGAALDVAERVRKEGVLAPAIRPPSVPAGSSRIRLTSMATHTDEMIERAVAAFAAAR
jgi:8-amino-7-oxononanoate synthase